ncbi:Zinc finger C2H2-type,Zinc finger, RING/FYVE/PHD-type [Cinara cedri]|uniref:Zinc finger C2H2-type,Zinc finger, RING/FYVE/PHD-type n=1 Tax=Cinara cedri TaxID=506608 RepID=A0A5E4MXP0_9HEMI|nr:Zinc finger C2H2-type,Zinc finger, RING/FYVE/PHD-type [Cinara cedri]
MSYAKAESDLGIFKPEKWDQLNKSTDDDDGIKYVKTSNGHPIIIMPERVGPLLPNTIYFQKSRNRRRTYRHHKIPMDPRNQVIYHVRQPSDEFTESSTAVTDGDKNGNSAIKDTDTVMDKNRKGRPKGSKNRPLFNSYNDQCDKRSFVYSFAGPTKCKSCKRTFDGDPVVHCHEYHKTECPICGRMYKPPLTSHIKSHGTRHVILTVDCYECYDCKEKFGNADIMAKHILDEHVQAGEYGAKVPACYICGWTTGTELDDGGLREHIATVHADTPAHLLDKHLHQQQKTVTAVVGLMCMLCGIKFGDQEAVIGHLVDTHCPRKTFNHPAVYKCRMCGAGFKSQINVLRHACNKIKSPHCAQCDKTFPSKMRYAFHLQFHDDHPKYATMHLHCDLCLAEFDDEYHLYDHIRFRHELHDKAVCETCGRTFKSSMGLNIHRRYHIGSRNFTCKSCNKSFLNKSTLREHEISHMDVKPFQCNICGQYLSRASRLRSHVKTHRAAECTEQTCYSCNTCGFVAPNLHLLAGHACKGHHDNSRDDSIIVVQLSSVVKCEFCDSTFVNAEHLNAHRDAAHANGGGNDSSEAFVCVVCSSRFSTYSRLTTHKLTHGINMKSMEQTEDDNGPDDPEQEVLADQDRFTVPQYFACQYCAKRCLHYTYFCLHRRLKHPLGDLAYKCDRCSMDFETSWKLSYHKKTVHGQSSEEKIPKKYECTLCSRKFVKIGALNLHKTRSHIDVGIDVCKYLCHHCGKFFSSECSLKNHSKTHDSHGVTDPPSVHTPKSQPTAVNHQRNRYRTYRKSTTTNNSAVSGKPTIVQNSCPYCPYSTDEKATFIDHVTRHIQSKSISFVPTITTVTPTDTTMTSTVNSTVTSTDTAMPFTVNTTISFPKPDIFRCQLCDVEFYETVQLFRVHLENHADSGETLLCRSCYVPFTSSIALDMHRHETALCGQRPDVRFVDVGNRGEDCETDDQTIIQPPLVVDCAKIFKDEPSLSPLSSSMPDTFVAPESDFVLAPKSDSVLVPKLDPIVLPTQPTQVANVATPNRSSNNFELVLDELMAIISSPRLSAVQDEVKFEPSNDSLNSLFDSICTPALDQHRFMM